MTPATQPLHHGGADSHLPLLLACVAATPRPILEIGIGSVSTPILHSLCLQRPLTSLEDSAECREIYRDYFVGGHEIYDDTPAMLKEFTTQRWGVVFIDDSPGGWARANQLEIFLPVADYVVMHDVQDTGDNYGPVMEVLRRNNVPNWFIHNRYFPWTLAASMTRLIPRIP